MKSPLMPLLLVTSLAACGSRSEPESATAATRAKQANERLRDEQSCPAYATAQVPLAGVRPEHLDLEYWLSQLATRHDLDRALMSVDEIDRHNRAVGRRGDDAPVSHVDLTAPYDRERLQHDAATRLQTMHERLTGGTYVDAAGGPLPQAALAMFDAAHIEATRAPSLHVILEPVLLRCGPHTEPLYASDSDRTFDRNACSMARAQEVVQVLGVWPNGMQLVRTAYALGWLPPGTQLSPTIMGASARQFVHGPHQRATQAMEVETVDGTRHSIALGTRLPQDAGDKRSLTIMGPQGPMKLKTTKGFEPTRAPLTRRALLNRGFTYMGAPYGYGGAGGGIDCSRLLMDLWASFDLALPRHSGWQARAGTYAFDVSEMAARQKQQIIDRVDPHGVVLLQLPGHIMLYLGRADDGRAMVLHSLGEFAAPCPDAPPPDTDAGPVPETVFRVQRVTVTDLALGTGSSRTALIERVTRIAVFGAPPDTDLHDVATWRASAPTTAKQLARCRDSLDAQILTSPAHPHTGQPLRIVAANTEAFAPAELRLFDPKGELVPADPIRLGGPPYGVTARVESPRPGIWTAALTDGDRVVACKRIRVHGKPTSHAPRAPDSPVWAPERNWARDTENLYAAFVERLFDYPLDDDRTWQNLHSLLRDRDRNLLHNHLGLGEDETLQFTPDCADLPYTLRAYFAWKLRLPFAYRHCTRGRPGVPPRCGPLRTHLEPAPATSEISAFGYFANRAVRNGVHSASSRTHPEDEEADFYPVPLQRETLPAGTSYADPYGHVMMLVKWYPQGLRAQDYGVLMAAEAQPDGTISRRRFWPGSFLFTPATDEVGAGFKAFRPLRYDEETRSMQVLDNATLARAAGDGATRVGATPDQAPFSMMQYEGSSQDFYDRMEALIHPRPLDAAVRLRSLVDALQEQVERRVTSVDNGERYIAERRGAPIDMPRGHAIFETTGAWEDFATPSRDMRMLIAIDTVTGLIDRVKRRPAAYGLEEAELEEALKSLAARLHDELSQRTFYYIRSDGAEQQLSLQDIVERSTALELAYNPNDCVERRWGAPEASEELRACARSAPPEQRARMLRYRTWFSERTRPRRDVTE